MIDEAIDERAEPGSRVVAALAARAAEDEGLALAAANHLAQAELYRAALAVLDARIAAAPGSVHLLLTRAQISAQVGDNDGCADALVRTLRVSPTEPQAWSSLAHLVSGNVRNPQDPASWAGSIAALLAMRSRPMIGEEASPRPRGDESDADRDGETGANVEIHALRAQLAQERLHGEQLLAQLQAVGKELAAERERSGWNGLPAPARPLADGVDPDDVGGWNALGHRRMGEGDFAGARVAFGRALEIVPDAGDLWLSLGHALSAAGEGVASTKAFHRCLSVDLDRVSERRGLSQLRDSFVAGNAYYKELDPLSLEPPFSGLLIVTLPKTGTEFISNALSGGLDKPALRGLAGGLFPNALLSVGGLDKVRATGGVLVSHYGPSVFNRTEVSHRLDRMVVHVRDPRQNLVSWAHFIPAVIRHTNPVQSRHMKLPQDFSGLPFEQQMDWYIEHLLPDVIGFITGWLDAPSDPEFRTRILFTTQEELAADSDAFFDRLLAFHDIDPKGFARPPKPRAGHLNFREGRTDEWRSAMTPVQRDRVTAAIPGHLFDRFGWPRR